MMVFLEPELLDDLLSEHEEPDVAFAQYLRSELKLPAVADERGIYTTRGRLDMKHTDCGAIRVMYHEIH